MSQGTGGRLSIRVQIEGISEAETKLKSLGSAIDSLGTKLSGTATSISKLPQSLNSLKTASESAATSIQKLPTALNAINASSGVAAIDRLKQSVTGLGGTLTTAASSVQQFSSRVQQSMQSISTGGGLTSVQTAVTGLNTTFNAGIPTIQRYGTTLTSLGTSASSTSGGLNTMKSGLDNLTASSEKAGQSAGRTTQQWATMGGRIGGVALSTVILTSAIDEAVGMQAMLEQAQGKTTMAQNAYNAAVQQFGPSSAEAVRAQQALDKAQNALTFATRNTGFAWRDIIPIAGLMVTQAIEPMIQGFSRLKAASDAAGGLSNLFKGGLGAAAGGISSAVQSLATAFKPISTEATAATKGLDAVSVAMESTSQKAGLLRTSIAGLTFAGFLGVIGAVAAALLALATNVGGSRDAMNELGESVAKQVPELEGLLTFFGKAIEGLGQLMGVQSEADKLWIANATKIAEANKLIETSLKGPFEAFQAFTDIVEQQGQLKPLDQLFGGGGLGQVLADLTQMTTIFDTMATSNDIIVDTLQPVINSLVRIKDEVNTFGGESLNRYNEAWAFANKLMKDYMNEGTEPTTQQLGTLRNMINQVGSTINKDLIDPFEAAIASGDKWTVTGTMIKRGMEDTSATMTEMGNLVHVTGNTFMTESGGLVTFAEGFTKIKDESANTEEGLKRITDEITKGKGILQDFIGDAPKLMFDYANAVKTAADAEVQHTIKLQESAAAFGATAVEIQKMTEAGGLAAFNTSMAEADAASQEFTSSLRLLAQDLGMGMAAFTSNEEAVRNWIATHGEVAPTLQEINQAIVTLAQTLIDDTKSKTANAEATRALIGSTIEMENVYATLDESLANTESSISRLNVELNTQEGQFLAWQNAVASGEERFLQFIQSSREGATEAQRYTELLQGTGAAFAQLPSWMEPTIENLESFRKAQMEGGQAAVDFKEKALESWRGLASEAETVFNDLKGAWKDIFSGETANKQADAIAQVNAKIKSNFEQQQKDIQGVNDKMWENMTKTAEGGGQKTVDIMEGVKTTTVGLFDGVDWEGLAEAMVDPIQAVFDALPPRVQATMTDVDKAVLSSQAMFATVGEEAGMAWGIKLQASMDQGSQQATALANQAAIDVLAPFLQEHPEAITAFQPVLDALQYGTPEAVKAALDSLAGMPGPWKEVAAKMIAGLEGFTGQIGPKVKTGVENAIDALSVNMEEIFDRMTERLLEGIDEIVNGTNTRLNKIDKKDPVKIRLEKEALERDMGNIQKSIDAVKQSRTPKIDVDTSAKETKVQPFKTLIDGITDKNVKVDANTDAKDTKVKPFKTELDGIVDKSITVNANTNPANTQIQLIGKAVADLQTFLTEDAQLITLHASQTNPLEPQIQLMSTSITQAKDFLAEEQNTISMVGANVNPLEGQITLAAGAPELVNKSLQENPITMVGANTNPLAGQITSATQGPDLVQKFLDQNTITLVAANTNPLVGQVTLVSQMPAQVNRNLQQNTITMVAANTNPLAGQVTLVTRQPQQVNQNLAQTPITMVGANTNPLESQVQLAYKAHQDLQNWLNQNPITMPGAQGGVGGYGGMPTGQRGAYGGPGFAKGFGPAIVNKPTMMLVGEAGPELVSVQPEPGLKMMGNIPYVRAQEGYGDPYYGGQGQGMDYGAMEDAVQQGAQEGSQQGSQQGVQEGMQQGYQQAPSNTEYWGAGRFGWSPSGGMGGGGAGQYPEAPSNTEMWGAGRQYWGGGRFGTQLGGGGAPPPQYPSASVPMGVNETIGFGSRPRYYTWTGGAMGTALTPSGPGLAPPPSQTQGQGQQMANDLTRGFQQGMGGNSQVWVNQGLKAGQNMGTGTVMGYEQYMRGQQGRWNSMPNTVFRGFPAGAAHFGGLMGDAMMDAMGDVIGDSAAQIFPQLYDQWGNSFAKMLAEFNQAASGAGGGGGGYGGGGGGTGTRQPTMPSQNVPAYTGQVPASYGPPLGQSFGNAGRATMLPGQYAGTGQWPPQQPTGGGGGGMTPQQMHQANQGGYPGSAPVYGVPGQSYGSPSGGGGRWYGPNDPRNTVFAQHGFHGIIDKTTRFIAHANERVDITPGPRGQINTDAIKTAYKNEINDIVSSVKQMVSETTGKVEHFHIYLGNEKIKEIIRKTAGTQMDRFIR